MPQFTMIAHPLHQLTRKSEESRWVQQCQQAFQELKDHLTSTPVVPFPSYSLLFRLYTNVSLTAIRSGLAQVRADNVHIIAYASCTLLPSEKNYSAKKRECLGIMWALHYFFPYVAGTHVSDIMDHQYLQWL